MPELEVSVSATTRRPRPGEISGRDYHFLSDEEFDERLRRGLFLEHASYAGHRYGTPTSELERPVTSLVLEIEIQGARQVRETLPEALQVFIVPPSLDALRDRLRERGAESDEEIEGRLAVARRELEAKDEFRHVIVNDDLERAASELHELVATMWGRQPRGAPE